MHCGIFHEVRLPGVSQDQIQAALFSAFFDLHPYNRVSIGRMRSHQKYGFGGIVIFQKGADRTIPELPSQGRFGRPVSQSGTVVDVVVADDDALEFL